MSRRNTFFTPVLDDQQINQSANDLRSGQSITINLEKKVVVNLNKWAALCSQNGIHEVNERLMVIANVFRGFGQAEMSLESVYVGTVHDLSFGDLDRHQPAVRQIQMHHHAAVRFDICDQLAAFAVDVELAHGGGAKCVKLEARAVSDFFHGVSLGYAEAFPAGLRLADLASARTPITRCSTSGASLSGHIYMVWGLEYPIASAAFLGVPPRRLIAFCLSMHRL